MLGLYLFFHLLFVIIWFSYAPVELMLRRLLMKTDDTPPFLKVLDSYLRIGNQTGIVGLVGVLITGIILTIEGQYGFFATEWIAVKQGIMLLIMALTFGRIIPFAARLRRLSNEGAPSIEGLKKSLQHFGGVVSVQHLLILLNILLGILGRSGMISMR